MKPFLAKGYAKRKLHTGNQSVQFDEEREVERPLFYSIGHRLSPPFLPESMSIDMRVKCLTLINIHDSFKSSFNSTISKY